MSSSNVNRVLLLARPVTSVGKPDAKCQNRLSRPVKAIEDNAAQEVFQACVAIYHLMWMTHSLSP